MTSEIPQRSASGLERLCIDPTSVVGIERLHMALSGAEAFSPHRHDTLAVGMTLRGVQTFLYRGERRISMPGDIHVLAPDELHDGAPGTDEGFEYRIVYVEPTLLEDAFGPGMPSFRSDPIICRPQISAETRWMLWGQTDDQCSIRSVDAIAALSGMIGIRSRPSTTLPIAELRWVKEMLDASLDRTIQMAELELASGIDRWAISRGFRRMFGTSPSRYRIMRRLDAARRQIAAGGGLADAAYDAGFADQSHFTRHFKAAFGMSPGIWAGKLRALNSRAPSA